MARPIWKGYVSFGLVQIPVELHSAESRYDLHFHLLDSRDHARVRYERINETTGEDVPWNEVVKAYEYDDNNFVVLSPEDFKRAAVEASQAVEIEDFIDAGQIPPLYFDRPYYLAPAKQGEKAYALLREALRRSGRVGIARLVIRTREHLAALLVQDRALVLNLLRFPQELRDPSELDLPVTDLKKLGVDPRELDMAEKLIESMSAAWKPEKYRDEYREALMKWIEKKARAGGAMPAADKEEHVAAPSVVNITELLRKSLRQRSQPKPATLSRPRRPAAARKRKPA